ncbi:MAG: hypothetical protein AAB510_00505 [Patescibacteria group bacterium]
MLLTNTDPQNNLFTRLNNIIKINKLKSLFIHEKKASKLFKIKCVIFFGSSASGKSTLEKILREVSTDDTFFQTKISVPFRVVTRNPRQDDENIVYATKNKFDELITKDSLAMYGVKNMESGRIERYGLLKPLINTLPIYFANNAIIKNPHSIYPTNFLDDALLIFLYAPDFVRENRLRIRSPELFEKNPDEANFRLSQEESSDNFISDAHVIVNNYGVYEQQVKLDIVYFLKSLVKII